MKAITVGPSGGARLDEVPEPDLNDGSVLVETIAVGICGTDREIAKGAYGATPPGRSRLILGHESLGRVIDPGPASRWQKGDLVVGIVRRPDPVPCPSCAVGEWDMCHNGLYTEHGIKQVDGFMSERWRIEPERAIKVDPALGFRGVLLEPASVVAKAWEHILAVGRRAFWEPRTVLIIGAGPIGLLGALIGAQLGFEVHVLDRTTTGPKPELVRALGASYHTVRVAEVGFEPDIILECTGDGDAICDARLLLAPSGVLCLAGIGHGGHAPTISSADLASAAVLKNNVVIGSVNANKRHYYKAAQTLARADRSWLARLITRREPPASFAAALEWRPGTVKVVLQFADV